MGTPATNWQETIAVGEEQRFKAYAEVLCALQRQRKDDQGLPRALHAKATGVARATLTVRPDLPAYARQGLFEMPASFQALVRYSNGSGARQHDRTGDVRGIAIKVLSVPGKKLLPGLEDARTQDFLLIHTPTSPFSDPDEFVGFVAAAGKPPKWAVLGRLLARFGVRRTLALVAELERGLGAPVTDVAEQRYWSVLPIAFAAYAARLTLLPHAEPASAPPAQVGRDGLAERLATRLKTAPVRYDLAAQFFVDAKTTPIEDATVQWPEEIAPPVVLATLELPAQDLADDAGRALGQRVERLSFDPWHALVAHRPLGAMMRARKVAYYASVMARGTDAEPEDAL